MYIVIKHINIYTYYFPSDGCVEDVYLRDYVHYVYLCTLTVGRTVDVVAVLNPDRVDGGYSGRAARKPTFF